jgi:hypothetical protein
MPIFDVPTSNAVVLTALCAGVVAIGLLLYRRGSSQNRQLNTAINNMSQGLCMFDAQTRIVLVNRRYIQRDASETWKTPSPICGSRSRIFSPKWRCNLLDQLDFDARGHRNEKHQHERDEEADDPRPHDDWGSAAASAGVNRDLKQRKGNQHPKIGRQADVAALRHHHDDAAGRDANNECECDENAVRGGHALSFTSGLARRGLA